jgi:hypothetical protein
MLRGVVVKNETSYKRISEGLLVRYPRWGYAMLIFFHQLEFRSRKRGELNRIYLWENTHSSIFLRNSLRNSSSVTLRYTSRFICVVRNLFRKRRHTFRTVHIQYMKEERSAKESRLQIKMDLISSKNTFIEQICSVIL